jgi:hypothetical protein
VFSVLLFVLLVFNLCVPRSHSMLTPCWICALEHGSATGLAFPLSVVAGKFRDYTNRWGLLGSCAPELARVLCDLLHDSHVWAIACGSWLLVASCMDSCSNHPLCQDLSQYAS